MLALEREGDSRDRHARSAGPDPLRGVQSQYSPQAATLLRKFLALRKFGGAMTRPNLRNNFSSWADVTGVAAGVVNARLLPPHEGRRPFWLAVAQVAGFWSMNDWKRLLLPLS